MEVIAFLLLFFVAFILLIVFSLVVDELGGNFKVRKMNKNEVIRTLAFRGALVTDAHRAELETDDIDDNHVFAPLSSGLRCGEYSLNTKPGKVLAIEYLPEVV